MVTDTLRERRLGVEYAVSHLAKHLRWSHPWPELLKILATDEVLDPLCILGMTQNLYDSSHRRRTPDFVRLHFARFKNHHAEVPIDRRSMIMLRAYEALASGDRFCLHYLPAAIELCQKELGYLDPFTLKVRIDFALRSFRTGRAHSLLTALLHDLTNQTLESVPEPERHLLTDNWTQEDLLDLVRESLAIAERCHAWTSGELATKYRREECTENCRHHIDFAVGKTASSLAFSVVVSDGETDTPALSFSTSIDDAESRPATPTAPVCTEDETRIPVLESVDSTSTSWGEQLITARAMGQGPSNVDQQSSGVMSGKVT